MNRPNPFRYFMTSPEIIRLAVMMYVRFPLSLRNVEDLLHERGIEISHETVRFWWNRLGPMFAAEIRRRRVNRMRAFSNWRWHVDEVFVKINGERHYLWRAVDHEGERRGTIFSRPLTTGCLARYMLQCSMNMWRPFADGAETALSGDLTGDLHRDAGTSPHGFSPEQFERNDQ